MKEIILATAAIACAQAGAAQEVAYLDLASVTPRTELRRPPVPEKECTVHHRCGFLKSVNVGGDVSPEDKRSLRTTLMWMDKMEYRDGDRAEVEVMVMNAGEVPIDVPWTPHLADLQPADDAVPFDVSTFGISIEMMWPAGNSAQIGTLILYGSPDHSGTLLNLKPGEWVRLRGWTTLSLLEYKGAKLRSLAETLGAVANSWMRLERYSPQPGGLVVNERNIYPHRLSGPPISLRLLTD